MKNKEISLTGFPFKVSQFKFYSLYSFENIMEDVNDSHVSSIYMK